MNTLILVNLQHGIPAGLEQDLIPAHKDYPEILLEWEAAVAPSPGSWRNWTVGNISSR